MSASIDERFKLDWGLPLRDIQRTNSLGTVNLVSAQGEKIDSKLPDVHTIESGGLHGIAMKDRSAVVRQPGHIGERMQYANLVVGGHHAEEQGVIGHRIA